MTQRTLPFPLPGLVESPMSRVELADPVLLSEMDHQRRRSNLGALLWDIATDLPKISEAMTLNFFTLSATRKQ